MLLLLIHLWDIEHAFYYWQYREEAESEPDVDPEPETADVAEPAETLPSSYIPPIVSILPDLARRAEQMIALAEQNGTTVESLFENRLAVCFRILSYKVEDLGQGTRRNPDGIFTYRGNDGSYAVIYDVLIPIDYGRGMNGSLKITSISILASFNGEALITSISPLSRNHSLMRRVKRFGD